MSKIIEMNKVNIKGFKMLEDVRNDRAVSEDEDEQSLAANAKVVR